jgi:hypothetical protein
MIPGLLTFAWNSQHYGVYIKKVKPTVSPREWNTITITTLQWLYKKGVNPQSLQKSGTHYYNHCNVVIVIVFHSYEKTVGLYLLYITTVML